MAQTVITTDDIDGSSDATTVEFSFDGANYSIDLSKKNRAAFEKVLKPYIEASTPKSSRSRGKSAGRARTRRANSPRSDLGDVRAWANAQGISVSERGRIAGDVLDAYAAAH